MFGEDPEIETLTSHPGLKDMRASFLGGQSLKEFDLCRVGTRIELTTSALPQGLSQDRACQGKHLFSPERR